MSWRIPPRRKGKGYFSIPHWESVVTFLADEKKKTGLFAGKRKAREPEEPESLGRELYYMLENLVIGLAVLILLFSFVGRIIVVDGTSMVPTLQDRDLMVVRSIGYTPRQGDVVVLTQRSYSDQALVKRVIATGGQSVLIDYTAGTVSVDGVVLDEPYINEAMMPKGDITAITVPEGCLFVMGDNRNHSLDSRFYEVGIVDERSVLGQAIFVVFPFSSLGTIG